MSIPPNQPPLLSLLFGLTTRVNRKVYAITGGTLMLGKYLIDTALIYFFTHIILTPLDYLSPLVTLRQKPLEPTPEWLMLVMLLWTLPFFWIGVSMSVRRAIDAGISPWFGMLFFVPIINYVLMIALCWLPSVPGANSLLPNNESSRDETLKSSILAICSSVVLTFVMIWVAVYVLEDYGFILFFGTPFLLGAINAYIFNYNHPRTFMHTMGITALGVVFSGTALLLFALEGIICLLMAAPIALGIAAIGASFGFLIANTPRTKPLHATFAILLLPVFAAGEKVIAPQPLYEVVTTIEINAPPEKIWPNVIGFSELPPTDEWLFKAGIAYPQRARIVGEGVGAMRYCEFSTGAFVEPITVWEKPYRLGFDVVQQPLAMQEWSPYRHLHPPHLDGTMRSRRGEFRLVPLGQNRTRLEGRTWYELNMRPEMYWTIWSDRILHNIHHRVLSHIKNLSEIN